MGEEGIEDKMEHEFEYPRYKFSRELVVEDEQELVVVTFLSYVFAPKEGLTQVTLEGMYTYHNDKDIDAEMLFSMQFHEKCYEIYSLNPEEDGSIDFDSERLE